MSYSLMLVIMRDKDVILLSVVSKMLLRAIFNKQIPTQPMAIQIFRYLWLAMDITDSQDVKPGNLH